MNQSAEDALKALRVKIENSIEETERAKQYAIDKRNFIIAHEFSIAIGERFGIIYTIDEMLDKLEKEEKHTHKWKWQNDIGYRCECGIILLAKQAEEYINKWQEQLDHTQKMQESYKKWHI